jgi:aldose sugar dehydrogenase
MNRTSFCLRVLAAALSASLGSAALAQGQIPPTTFPRSTTAPDNERLLVETVTGGLVHPWGMSFLPDGRLLVTERPGRLRIVSAGADGKGELSAPLAGLPGVAASGQGGLLDVAVDPNFAVNRFVFFSYAESGPGGSGTAVARGVLEGGGLSDVRVIYRQQPKTSGSLHFGSRIVFARDGTLWVTQGDKYGAMQSAQDLSTTLGKIVRITRDGAAPPDNPLVNRSGARPEIWSYGHRNVQGAAMHPQTGRLWTAEHGAQGGDEINSPEAGKNYGWPVITYGTDYGGAKIGAGITQAPGMEQPIHYYDPSIAPSGAAFVTGEVFRAWQGDLLVGALRGQHLSRLTIRDNRVVAEQRYLTDLRERIRDVRMGPDGFIYLLTDSPEGRLLRVRWKN